MSQESGATLSLDGSHQFLTFALGQEESASRF